jgi:uncharacterized protein YdhG (YjbR/CyaY superfamily)
MATPSTVDEYLAALPDEQRAALEEIRETIRAAAPETTETISYRMPAFKDRGRILVWYAAFSDHYSLFPASEAVREALGEKIEPYLSGKGTIRLAVDEPLPAELITRIVGARLQENAGARER